MTTLLVADRLTQAYPGRRGAEVEVRDVAGKVFNARLEDVVNAGAAEVRARFHAAAAVVIGSDRSAAIAGCIDSLERSEDAGRLSALLSVAE